MAFRSVRVGLCSCLFFASLSLQAGSALAQDITSAITAPTVHAAVAPDATKDDRPRQLSTSRIEGGQATGVVSDLLAPLAGDFGRLASRQNLLLLGIGGASAFAAHPFDSRIATSGFEGDRFTSAFASGQTAGSFLVQTGGALATYAAGRMVASPRVATIGAALFRAQIVAQTTTQGMKFATGRTRPDGTPLSFPSGHSSSAFATATVLQSELGWKAGVPAYAVASWIAASRVQAGRHYVSDV